MTESTTASETVPPPSLQDRIQTLTDVHNRLQALRHVPSLLLKPPSISPLADFTPSFDTAVDRDFAATFNSTPAHDFRALNDFLGVLSSVKVQEALRAARASEQADQSELGLSFRRENRKRKRPQSPVGSPQPYIPSPPRTSSFFPPPEDDPPPVRAESLVEFVRDFNRGTLPEFKMSTATEVDGPPLPDCKLAIWSRTETLRDELKAAISTHKSGTPTISAGKLTIPVVLRFLVSDVLTTYISLIFTNLEDQLVVESVTAFGPRERKLPHEQSDYHAFQILTQHIAKMISSHPRVPLQTLINVLVSYRGLFVERCTNCQRVLSAEGHIPPVGRIWTPREAQSSSTTNGKSAVSVDSPGPPAHPTPPRGDPADHATGHWEARHATCLYN